MNLRKINLGALRAKHEREPMSARSAIRYYNLMEVAAIAGYVPPRFPKTYIDRAFPILDGLAQHEDTNDFMLLKLHRLRLRGEWQEANNARDLPAIFIAFEEAMLVFDEPDVHAFLELLTAGNADGRHLAEIVDIVRKPERFAAAFMTTSAETAIVDSDEVWKMLSDPNALRKPMDLAAKLRTNMAEKRSPEERAVHGLRKLILLCRDLQHLLDSVREYSFLRPAMWLCAVAPFGASRLTAYRMMREAVEAFASWTHPKEAAIAENETADLLNAMEVVMNEAYGAPIESLGSRRKRGDGRHFPRRNPTVGATYTEMTVALPERHVTFLDRTAIDVRLNDGRAMSRAEVVRALIECAIASEDRDALEAFLAEFAGTSEKRESTQPAAEVER